MRKNYYYIANWKMYFSYAQALAWCNENNDQLMQLANNNRIILCPSYDSLATVRHEISGMSLSLGAQNCSEHLRGAYTGQISAQSLKEIGVSHCIIGHSETRTYYGDSNKSLLQKLKRLIEQEIIPIFCIGESLAEYKDNGTQACIQRQLEPIIDIYGNDAISMPCFIAYEPIWAIGTGVVAQSGHIRQVLAIVRDRIKVCKSFDRFLYIYGGTVTSQTVSELKQIEFLDGFLIGNASTNFQELKKIVL